MRRLAVIVVFSCLGCATTALDFTSTREAPRPLHARSADRVEVFMNAPPARAHVEVGVVEAQQEPGSIDGSSELIAKMRSLAGQHGCDGLANFTNNDSVTETMFAPGGGTRKHTLSGYRASCIVYVSGPELQPNATPTAVQPPACVPNATQLCFGPGGCRGGQSCTADGRGWSPCDCGNTAPLPGSDALQPNRPPQ